MRKIRFLIILSSFIFVCIIVIIANDGKVGINTTLPASALDVNGTTRINGELFLGGSDSIPGTPGKANNLIVSQGKGKVPVWQNIDDITPDFGDYFLKTSVVNRDEKGLRFPYNKTSGSVGYTLNQIIPNKGNDGFESGKWQIFDELTIKIPAMKNPFKVVISFQAIAKSGYVGSDGDVGWNSFSVGVCVDDPKNSNQKILKAIRSSVCSGVKNPQTLFFLYAVLDDLPPDIDTNIYIVATHRNLSNNASKENAELVLGRDLSNAIVDQSFLNKASVRANIFEKVK